MNFIFVDKKTYVKKPNFVFEKRHYYQWVNDYLIRYDTPGACGHSDIYWLNHKGQQHRDNDLPATLSNYIKDNCRWYQNGELHRIGKPARINGEDIWWYMYGQLHCETGPAYHTALIEGWFEYGCPRDYLIGPAVVGVRGNISYYTGYSFHRDYGPAVICIRTPKYWRREINKKFMYDKWDLVSRFMFSCGSDYKKMWFKKGILKKVSMDNDFDIMTYLIYGYW